MHARTQARKHTRTWSKDVALKDLDDRIALQWVREEDADDEGDVDKHGQYAVLRDGQHYQLLDVLAVTQVANQTEGAEDDADKVDAGVEEVREQVTVAFHARLDRDQLEDMKTKCNPDKVRWKGLCKILYSTQGEDGER